MFSITLCLHYWLKRQSVSSTNKSLRVSLQVENTQPIYFSIEQWDEMGSDTDKFRGISRNFCNYYHSIIYRTSPLSIWSHKKTIDRHSKIRTYIVCIVYVLLLGEVHTWKICFKWLIDWLCHAQKVPNPHGFTRHQRYSCSSQVFHHISFYYKITGCFTARFQTKYSVFW